MLTGGLTAKSEPVVTSPMSSSNACDERDGGAVGAVDPPEDTGEVELPVDEVGMVIVVPMGMLLGGVLVVVVAGTVVVVGGTVVVVVEVVLVVVDVVLVVVVVGCACRSSTSSVVGVALTTVTVRRSAIAPSASTVMAYLPGVTSRNLYLPLLLESVLNTVVLRTIFTTALPTGLCESLHLMVPASVAIVSLRRLGPPQRRPSQPTRGFRDSSPVVEHSRATSPTLR